MSRRRACVSAAIVLLLVCLLGPTLGPYAAYTLPNYYRYRVNLAKWHAHSPSYTATVYVNQSDERLYGENFIEVKAGQLVSGTNT